MTPETTEAKRILSPTEIAIQALANHQLDPYPDIKVGFVRVLLDNVAVGPAGPRSTNELTRPIDELFMNFHNLPPNPALIGVLEEKADEIAVCAEGALDRLRTDNYRGELGGISETAEFHILNLLNRIPRESTQLVLAKRAAATEGRTASHAKELLMTQVHSRDRRIYPSILNYLLNHEKSDAVEMGWSIIERDPNAGFDPENRRVIGVVNQKLEEMLDGDDPQGKFRAAELASILHTRTEGRVDEEVYEKSIVFLGKLLQLRLDWIKNNLNEISKSRPKDNEKYNAYPYHEGTRIRLQDLLESFGRPSKNLKTIQDAEAVVKEHEIYVKMLRSALGDMGTIQNIAMWLQIEVGFVDPLSLEGQKLYGEI